MLHLQKRYSYLLLFLFLPALCFTQELNYVHYNTKDGLAGSTVYDLCQDKDGFMWFATENGLSRFDGTNFRNFTVKDGLPDNEVLRVTPDSKGRLWIMPFNKEIAYYYKGNIYNKKNDKLLQQLVFLSNAESVAENDRGEIAITDKRRVYFIDTDNSVKLIADDEKTPGAVNSRMFVRNDFYNRGFMVSTGGDFFLYHHDSLHFFKKASTWYDRHMVAFRTDSNENMQMIEMPYEYISYEGTSWGVATFVNTYNGSLVIDTVTGKIKSHFLPGKKISHTIKDKEGSLWFSSLGEGAFKLSSEEVKTFKFTSKDRLPNNEVFSFTIHNNKLVCGLGFSEAVLMDGMKQYSNYDFSQYLPHSTNQDFSNRLYCSKSVSDDILLLGFDSYLVKLDGNQSSVNFISPIKTIDMIDKDFVLAGTATYAYKMRVSDLRVVDTIWKDRSTKIFYYNKKYYIGTFNGLYEVNEDKSFTYLGDKHTALTRRVTDIKAGNDGMLYIATNDNGIVFYKNGKVIATITEDNELSSNICRALYFDENFLWVGTNKGLNKIDISKAGYPVIKYSVGDGLPSDIINAVYVKDSIVWLGSPAGLSYFNEKGISGTSMCNIVMTSISVSGKQQQAEGIRFLPSNTRNINFEFAGISFKSGNDIVYYYKLDGLDADWKETRQNNLAYQSLPSGDYELQVYAVNKFGKKSDTISVRFSIETPFWKEWWFYAVIFLAAVSLTAWLVNRRSRKILEVREEKSRVQQQFASLEQQALQAQMNPHFIFNCLNSIQQYILTNDKEKANQYLTGFASLVRQTLDNSGKRTITIAEEIAYLTKYLEMEEMRFGDNFTYEIVVDRSVNPETMEIPALLLQPYVENCLRHGVRYKVHGTGRVHISFKVIGNVLYCTVRDNGIGRQKAGELKSRQHIEYQSRGMKLTAKRIELLNKINNNHVTAEIIDLKDEEGNAAGTEVIVKIPLNDHE